MPKEYDAAVLNFTELFNVLVGRNSRWWDPEHPREITPSEWKALEAIQERGVGEVK